MTIPHLHILHLQRREDRLQLLLRQMEWNKVPYTIWEGIEDPNNVKQAITRGHKKIIQHAKDNDLYSVNIAEDDIVFTHKDSYKYFNETTPDYYDLYCGIIYSGTVEDNRILNGMSGTMTLYKIHNRFYDFVLSLPDDIHVDRELGSTAFAHRYYVTPKYCCYQSGGYSDQLRQVMYYDAYLKDKESYNG